VLRVLSERNCRVRAVVREGKENQLLPLAAIESIVASPDIFAESAAWWSEVCQGIDMVIHAAWYIEPGLYLQSPKNQDCLAGTLRLARGAIEVGVRRFIGVGTCFEYDLTAGRLTIDSPLRPATPYAKAKVEAFNALSRMLPQHGIAFAWCRLFYLYGEGEKAGRLVTYLRAQLEAGVPAELGSGEQIRDYLNVRDAAAMIAETALGSVLGPVNICSGAPVTIRQLAERFADEYGRRDLLRFGARADDPADPACVVGVCAAG
jgi:nucleoside-diphosphate-sugar epimerase